jgi:hypothetical protein
MAKMLQRSYRRYGTTQNHYQSSTCEKTLMLFETELSNHQDYNAWNFCQPLEVSTGLKPLFSHNQVRPQIVKATLPTFSHSYCATVSFIELFSETDLTADGSHSRQKLPNTTPLMLYHDLEISKQQQSPPGKLLGPRSPS